MSDQAKGCETKTMGTSVISDQAKSCKTKTMGTSVSSDQAKSCKTMDQHPVEADVCFQSVHSVSATNATLYEVGTISLRVIQLERQDH